MEPDISHPRFFSSYNLPLSLAKIKPTLWVSSREILFYLTDGVVDFTRKFFLAHITKGFLHVLSRNLLHFFFHPVQFGKDFWLMFQCPGLRRLILRGVPRIRGRFISGHFIQEVTL